MAGLDPAATAQETSLGRVDCGRRPAPEWL